MLEKSLITLARRSRKALVLGARSTATLIRRSGAPVIALVVMGLSLTQVLAFTLALFGVSSGEILNLSVAGVLGFEWWRVLTFPLSTHVGIHQGISDAQALSVAGFSLYALCCALIVLAGVELERRRGSSQVFVLMLIAVGMQAIVSLLAFQNAECFGPVAIVYALGVTFLATHPEPVHRGVFSEGAPRSVAQALSLAQVSIRKLVPALMVFLFVLCSICAAFEPAFQPVIVSAMAGSVAGALSLGWMTRLSPLELRYGRDELVAAPLVTEVDTLTLEEVRERVDSLLARVGEEGLASLSSEDQELLNQASQRLRRSRPGPGDVN